MLLNPTDTLIRTILSTVKTVALIGASSKVARDSHRVMFFMQAMGYRVIPVNPQLIGTRLLGEPVHGELADISEPVDMVDIFRKSEAVPGIVESAIAKEVRVVWMQLGVIHEKAAEKAVNAGLDVVMDRCPVIEMRRLGHPDRKVWGRFRHRLDHLL